jgi:hypothetical protein
LLRLRVSQCQYDGPRCQRPATTVGLLGICFHARRAGDGQNGDGRRGVRGLILRSDNGTFFDFGEGNLPAFDGMEGRFAQILPLNIPAEKERCLAKAILQVKGVAAGKPATKPERRHRR